MITRRHKCEDCATVYVCDECSEHSENELVHGKVKFRPEVKRFGNRFTGAMIAPECMRKFQCEECKNGKRNNVTDYR